MRHSADRILTTHCGSLPRPGPVVDLVERVELGNPVDDSEFEGAVRDAVNVAVSRQAEVGLSIINDGEQGKFNFGSHFQRRLSGFTLSLGGRGTMGGEMAAHPDYFERSWPYRGRRMRAVCTGSIDCAS